MAEEETDGDVKLLHPEDDIKPRVSSEVVPELVDRLYGLKVTSLKELPSYDDLNFFIKVDDCVDNSYIKEANRDGYVFKILNSLQSSQPKLIEAQHALKKCVRANGIPTQIPVNNKNGEDFSTEKLNLSDGNEAQYIVRLVTFIPGKTYVNTPYVLGTFVNVGKFLGRFHKGTERFRHSFYESYNTVWSLSEVPRLYDFLHAVKDNTNKALVKEVLESFEKQIIPNFNYFRRGIVHGDINEQNLIMAEVPDQDDVPVEQRIHDVACILDFFDAMYSYTVFDVAICIMYTSLDAPYDIQLDVGGYILSGYQEYMTLKDTEFDSLIILVCSRLCQSLVYGAHGYMLDPSNTYLLTTAKRGWEFLHRLWETPPDEIKTKWKNIMAANAHTDSRQRK